MYVFCNINILLIRGHQMLLKKFNMNGNKKNSTREISCFYNLKTFLAVGGWRVPTCAWIHFATELRLRGLPSVHRRFPAWRVTLSLRPASQRWDWLPHHCLWETFQGHLCTYLLSFSHFQKYIFMQLLKIVFFTGRWYLKCNLEIPVHKLVVERPRKKLYGFIRLAYLHTLGLIP